MPVLEFINLFQSIWWLKNTSGILLVRFSDVNEAREMESWLAQTSLIKRALIPLRKSWITTVKRFATLSDVGVFSQDWIVTRNERAQCRS